MAKSLESLVRSFVESSPEDAARAFEGLDAGEAARILLGLPVGAAAPLLERIHTPVAADLLHRLPPEQAKELVEAMSPRQAALLLHHVEQERREGILTALADPSARTIRDLLKYPEDSAGGMMEPQVASVPLDLTVQAAVSFLRKAPRSQLYYLYVTDREGRLAGILNMRDLLLASPRDPIDTLVRRELLSVPATMDREEVVTLMRQHQFLALPVVDAEGRLMGVVRQEEALEAGQEEAFEDMQRMVGAGGDERALEPVGGVVRRRLPWLYVNLATAFLASAVVALFEDLLGRVTALAVLLPIVSGQGGNSGAQALAVVIRGLALREILPGSTWRVIYKEAAAGFFNGLAIAVVCAAAVWVWSRNGGLSVVIGLAMVVNMAAAGLAGAAIPLVLKKLGRDPAQASSIFLTTVTDVVGFASFLGFALLLLSWIAP